MNNFTGMQRVYFKDLGKMGYKDAWDYQEQLLQTNTAVKALARSQEAVTPALPGFSPAEAQPDLSDSRPLTPDSRPTTNDSSTTTRHSLLFVEHPPVYTLGKSGKIENVLISEEDRLARGIEFFYTNRGGDITFHGPRQLVGYPVLDLEKFYTDIGRYLRNLEEVIIRTMAEYNLKGERSAGETGVWLDPGIPGKERKICAIGVRCSRWITMHGFAFNVNTDLNYFNHIIPCGIQNKQVTSLCKELNMEVDFSEVKEKVKRNFETVFEVQLAEEV